MERFVKQYLLAFWGTTFYKQHTLGNDGPGEHSHHENWLTPGFSQRIYCLFHYILWKLSWVEQGSIWLLLFLLFSL